MYTLYIMSIYFYKLYLKQTIFIKLLLNRYQSTKD